MCSCAEIPSIYENRHESWQTTGELIGTGEVSGVGVAIGTESVHDQLSSARLGGRRDWRSGVFGEASFGRVNRTSADLGVRGDHSSVYGDFFSPSLSTNVALSPNLDVHASGGAGFRAPTWTERFYTDPSNQGNPSLQAERFSTVDVGVRAHAGAWRLDVTGFARRAINLIDWVKPIGAPTTAVWEATNVGRATFRGIETTLDLPTIRGFGTSLFADGLSLTSTQGDTLAGKYALRPLTRQAGFRLATPNDHAITAGVDLEAARRASESGYVTGNVRLAWRRDAYRVTFDATNLANAVWLDASGKPAPESRTVCRNRVD